MLLSRSLCVAEKSFGVKMCVLTFPVTRIGCLLQQTRSCTMHFFLFGIKVKIILPRNKIANLEEFLAGHEGKITADDNMPIQAQRLLKTPVRNNLIRLLISNNVIRIFVGSRTDDLTQLSALTAPNSEVLDTANICGKVSRLFQENRYQSHRMRYTCCKGLREELPRFLISRERMKKCLKRAASRTRNGWTRYQMEDARHENFYHCARTTYL